MLNHNDSAACGGAVFWVQRGLGVSDEAGESMLNMKVPSQLREELKRQAAEQGVTLRVIVLRALKAAGFTVNDNELADRRPERSGRKKSA